MSLSIVPAQHSQRGIDQSPLSRSSTALSSFRAIL
jgi:hypothetical protein